MKTSLENISSVKKKLLIEIDSMTVDEKLNTAYGDLNKKVKIPGFRTGKIPRKILERKFGAQVADDLVKELINESFPQALNEVDLLPLGTPLLEKEILKQGEIFKYSAVMDVQPEVEVKDYLGIEVEKEILSITDEDILKQMEQIQQSHGTLETIEPQRSIQKNDFVLLDFEGFEDGKAIEGNQAKNTTLQVGDNRFHPQFETALINLNKGDETNINVSYNEKYPNQQLAGKAVEYKVKIHDIKEMVLPEMDETFFNKLGDDIKSIDDFKDKVNQSFIASEEKRIKQHLQQRLLKKIVDTVEIELPQTLVEAEIENALQSIKQNFYRNGSTIESAGLNEDIMRKELRPASEMRVKGMIVLRAIDKESGITINDDDLARGYQDMAVATGQDTETLKKYYEARNYDEAFKQTLLDEKTLSYLVEHAKVIEKEKSFFIDEPSSQKENN